MTQNNDKTLQDLLSILAPELIDKGGTQTVAPEILEKMREYLKRTGFAGAISKALKIEQRKDEIKKLIEEGFSVGEISKKLGINKKHVYYFIKRNNISYKRRTRSTQNPSLIKEVQLLFDKGYAIQDAAKKLGIPAYNIYYWTHKKLLNYKPVPALIVRIRSDSYILFEKRADGILMRSENADKMDIAEMIKMLQAMEVEDKHD